MLANIVSNGNMSKHGQLWRELRNSMAVLQITNAHCAAKLSWFSLRA
jgi:hypothetical protein